MGSHIRQHKIMASHKQSEACVMNTINDRIKEIRKNNKLNQKQFAQILGISQTHISKIESNKDMPSKKLQKLMCIEFNINEHWLETGEGSINHSKLNEDIIVNESIIKTKNYLQNASKSEKVLYANLLSELPKLLSNLNLSRFKDNNEYENQVLNTIFDVFVQFMKYVDFLNDKTNDLLGSEQTEEKINEIFDISNFYKEKINNDFESLLNLYLGSN